MNTTRATKIKGEWNETEASNAYWRSSHNRAFGGRVRQRTRGDGSARIVSACRCSGDGGARASSPGARCHNRARRSRAC